MKQDLKEYSTVMCTEQWQIKLQKITSHCLTVSLSVNTSTAHTHNKQCNMFTVFVLMHLFGGDEKNSGLYESHITKDRLVVGYSITVRMVELPRL